MTYTKLINKIADNLGDAMALGRLITPATVDLVDSCAPGTAQEPAFTATANTALLYDQGNEITTRLDQATTVTEVLQEFAHGNILAVKTYQQAEALAATFPKPIKDPVYTGAQAAEDVTEANAQKIIDPC